MSASVFAPDGGLRLLEGLVELDGGDVEHDAPVHRDEPPVRVVREPVVAGLPREALHRPVGEPQVEDGVHHPGHRELRAGTHADEQRVSRVAEASAHLLLELGDVLRHLVGEAARPPSVHVGAAGVGGDREARRHGQAEHRGHLGEVCPLAAQQVLHVHRRAPMLVVEGEHVGHTASLLGGHSGLPRASSQVKVAESAVTHNAPTMPSGVGAHAKRVRAVVAGVVVAAGVSVFASQASAQAAAGRNRDRQDRDRRHRARRPSKSRGRASRARRRCRRTSSPRTHRRPRCRRCRR